MLIISNGNTGDYYDDSTQTSEKELLNEEQDITVRNGDFFAALHMLMKDKHSYLRSEGQKHPDNGHKVS